jgi:hypothetical protein
LSDTVASRGALGKDGERMTKKRAGDGQDADLADALYDAPPRQFVAERKRVRDALAAAGRAAEAREVAKRKRPSASVWAVNQLARRAPDEIDALLELGASLRAGERKLIRGGEAGGFMDEARTARQKVAALVRRAEAFVEESGQKPTVALGRKIAQTLHAASIADDETRARLAAGRIDEDLAPPSSFGAGGDLATTLAASLAGSTKPQRKAADGHKHAAAHDRKHVAAADDHRHAAAADDRKHAAAERKRAASQLRADRRARAAARKHAAALARAATAADRVVADRTRAVDRARTAVERAEADLRAAKDALVDAETAATAAHRAADEAARDA